MSCKTARLLRAIRRTRSSDGARADACRMRCRVAADVVTAAIELANLRARQEARPADEVGQHEAMRAPTQRFEPIGDQSCRYELPPSSKVERERQGGPATRASAASSRSNCVDASACSDRPPASANPLSRGSLT